MNGFFRSTRFALDFATPVEGARTALDDCHFLRSVSPPAAHQIATVNTYRCVVALSTVGSKNSQSQIFLAKSGGLFEVDEVFWGWGLVVGVVWLQRELVSVRRKKIFLEILNRKKIYKF